MYNNFFFDSVIHITVNSNVNIATAEPLSVIMLYDSERLLDCLFI